ncbi:Protein-lysine N-methyltransferase EEF2KMT [Trichoplax sp. H2]|uniref:FAM86 N-terminal domain-containing protein n=1 Tax=Trichoplax adhaerens TaxID=10228 RepID=B3RQ18_TRIAD|nr:hypothetical protein TRIADDRAFT_63685 [Trichoplax adhaerens]EDV27743.1 hypothetical protein TRIADDRAFT_63685 [Trichoplax adhaerens]RDD39425.1 Protein-lysine N-methyltransferase EEF2KMT [Trichoplax sp. H2]|eukprot:XP_002109577.1 hypothetical protein TRIADDRAFT_63685 [Trichoplax adhaerens]
MGEIDKSIEMLQREYFSMIPLRFVFGSIKDITLDVDIQTKILYKTIKFKLHDNYPVSKRYTIAFLNEFISKCEKAGCEIIDELYEIYTGYISVKLKPEQYFYKSYLLPSGKTISISTAPQFVAHGTTGLNIWPASFALNEWIYQNKSIFDNRSVLELGSGVGLTGIFTCLECKPRRYTLSDCHCMVLQRLEKNLTINLKDLDNYNLDIKYSSDDIIQNGIHKTAKSTVELIGLNCETASEHDLSKLQSDIILASDLIFDMRLISSLVRTLQCLLRNTDTNKSETKPVAYICSTVRSENTYNFFMSELDAAGIHYEHIDFNPKNVCFINLESERTKLLKLWSS